jgi:predicted TIM-barrel fold metal-dependent hydrolase
VHPELVDHHCHSVLAGQLDPSEFELFLTESDRPPPPGCSAFDSLLGVAVRQRCAPLLDLPPGAEPDTYLARRAELGSQEANRRLLRAGGVQAMFIDTGLTTEDFLPTTQMAELSGARTREVVRLESVAEDVAASGAGATDFRGVFATALRERARSAVGLKSIIAYRYGLDFEPEAPAPREVRHAADRWLGQGGGRLTDPVLLRHLLWEALGTGLPLQLHTGFGDPDEDLRRSDPACLTEFLRLTAALGTPIMLLHCYPYHRQAAYLTNVFPHVYMDIGLAIPHVGQRAPAVLAETLELAPFHKLLYSSDAYGLAELHYLAASLFREALGDGMSRLVPGQTDAQRIAHMIGAGNAARVYSVGHQSAER